MQFDKDLNPGRIIASKMKNTAIVIHKKLNLKQIFSLIKYSKAVIAVRLHMLIFSATLGIPSIGIDYDPKIKGFQKHIGVPYILEKDDIQNLEYRKVVDEFMENHEKLCKTLEEQLPEIKQKAKENAKIASGIIYGERK
jgi:polysaccharide pyruvyl transferase WcaK-like protein